MSKESALAALTGISPPVQESHSHESPQTSTPVNPSVPQTTESPNSSAFSHLAKKEAEIVKQREAFKKEQQALAAEKERLSGIAKQYQDYQETKTKDPVAAMKLLGFSEQDIFNYMAAQQPEELTPEQKAIQAAEQAASAKIKEFEETQMNKEQEAIEKRDQGLIQSFRNEMSQTLKSNPDKFEYCNHYGPLAEELAYETVLEVLKESQGKELLTVEEALAEVESYYEEQDQLMSKLKKRQPKEPTVPTQKEEPARSRTMVEKPDSAPERKQIQHSRTLSNSTTATVASTRLKMNETREQKRDRLMEALRNGKI